MKLSYKFNELDTKAQKRAVLDYIEGWEETHDMGDLPQKEVIALLSLGDDDFDVNGIFMGGV